MISADFKYFFIKISLAEQYFVAEQCFAAEQCFIAEQCTPKNSPPLAGKFCITLLRSIIIVIKQSPLCIKKCWVRV